MVGSGQITNSGVPQENTTMYKHELYVPATVSLDAQDRVFDVLSGWYEGWTMNVAQGYWKGSYETVNIITIFSDKEYINGIQMIIDAMLKDGEETVLTTIQDMKDVQFHAV